MGPLNEITCTFYHLSTQGCTLVKNGLCILGVLVGSQDFATHFLDEVLFQDMVHIDDLLLLGDAHVTLGILFSCVTCRPFYLTWTIIIFIFLFLLASFDKKIMQKGGDIMGPRSWESF
jgi:hypothetical protein